MATIFTIFFYVIWSFSLSETVLFLLLLLLNSIRKGLFFYWVNRDTHNLWKKIYAGNGFRCRSFQHCHYHSLSVSDLIIIIIGRTYSIYNCCCCCSNSKHTDIQTHTHTHTHIYHNHSLRTTTTTTTTKSNTSINNTLDSDETKKNSSAIKVSRPCRRRHRQFISPRFSLFLSLKYVLILSIRLYFFFFFFFFYFPHRYRNFVSHQFFFFNVHHFIFRLCFTKHFSAKIKRNYRYYYYYF
jgi:hypothetical protein